MGTVNESDLDWTELEHGDTRFRRKQLGEAAGGEAIGCSLYELDPGAESWPYHYHAANEEALYVLAGSGTLRFDGEFRSLEPGDYVTFPPDASGAHAVVNDSDAVLRYLIVSEMHDPDVTVYPDSEKFGVFVGSAPGDDDGRTLEGYYRIEDDVDFWTGES